jgi:hypothetical protein
MAGDLEQGSKEVEIGGQPPEASGDSFGERELRSTDLRRQLREARTEVS